MSDMVQVMIPYGAYPGDTFRVQVGNEQVTLTDIALEHTS